MAEPTSPAIVQYWHDTSPPPEIEERMELVADTNPRMRHLVFSEATAASFIEAHFGKRELEAFKASAVPAMQADYFRYCAVYTLGGVYCDADAECSSSLLPLLDHEGQLFYRTSSDSGVRNADSQPPPHENHISGVAIGNSPFGFRKPNHPLLRLTIDIATTGIESRFCQGVGLVTGPAIFTGLHMMRQHGLDFCLERMGNDKWHKARSVDDEAWSRHLGSIRAIVGDDDRLRGAFDGVRVSSLASIADLIAPGSPLLAYKQTENHYPNWRGSIYR